MWWREGFYPSNSGGKGAFDTVVTWSVEMFAELHLHFTFIQSELTLCVRQLIGEQQTDLNSVGEMVSGTSRLLSSSWDMIIMRTDNLKLLMAVQGIT